MTPLQYAVQMAPLMAILAHKGAKAEHEALLYIQLCELHLEITKRFGKYLRDGDGPSETPAGSPGQGG